MKSYEIHLPYFKQGDDLAGCIESAEGDVVKALELHAEMLDDAAHILMKIKNVIEEAKASKEVYIEADTHFISIEGPKEVLSSLIDNELVEVIEFDDEDDDDDGDDDDDEDEQVL
mgnify:CR=1 FL=1